MSKIQQIAEAYFKTKQLLDKTETLQKVKAMSGKTMIKIAIMEGSNVVHLHKHILTNQLIDVVMLDLQNEIEALSDEINQIDIK